MTDEREVQPARRADLWAGLLFASLGALSLWVGIAACRHEKTGLSLPRYPGGTYRALPMHEYGSYNLFGAIVKHPVVVT